MSTLKTTRGSNLEGQRRSRPGFSISRPAAGLLAAALLCGVAVQPASASTPAGRDDAKPVDLQHRTFLPTRGAAIPSEMPDAGTAVDAIDIDAMLPHLSVLPEPKVKGSFPRGLHPVIKHSMVEASRYLPEGWQLEFMNALRDAPGVWNGPHGKRDHTGGALAVDVWLVNPQGQRLCNFKCAQHFDDYRRFMEKVKFIQDRDFPAYRKQGRWGGYFAGGYANDEMHYDLEPSDWTMAGNWKQGLLPGYAHFARKGDTLKGMGEIAGYHLPDARLGTLALAKAPPFDLMPPLSVPQRTTPAVPPVQVAAVQWSKPRYARQAQARPAPRRQARARYIRDDSDD